MLFGVGDIGGVIGVIGLYWVIGLCVDVVGVGYDLCEWFV